MIHGPQSPNDLPSFVACLVPPVRVPHARRVVEEDDDLARAGVGGRGATVLEEGPRERGDEQRERDAAENEEQQVSDLLPADRLVGNPLQKHQRRKLDHDLPLPVDQMDDHRDGDGGEAREEGRSEEVHRTRVNRCRAAKNEKSARSSGFDVSNIP